MMGCWATQTRCRCSPRSRSALLIGLALVISFVGPFERAAAAEPTKQQVESFEKKIRPLLAERCFACHSRQAKEVRGKLMLDSRAGMLEGGSSGPAIVPGDPEQSRLIRAARYADD